MLSFEEIVKLPKAELHLHLDGSLRASTLVDLAKQAKVELPCWDPRELMKVMRFGYRYRSLEDCLKVFDVTTSVLQTPESLTRVAFELVEDTSRENTTYTEVRFAPHLHTMRGMESDEALEAVLAGLKAACVKYDVTAKVIVCCIRNMSPALSLEMAQLASLYSDRGVVGFDVAGAEAGFSPLRHQAALVAVQRAGLGITIHAGEVAGRRTLDDALFYADRLGHGCTLIEHPFLLQRVIERKLAVECCPTSNFQTGAVNDLTNHPLKQMLDAGVRVTINSDNRLVSNTCLSQELWLSQFKLKLTDEQLLTIVDNGFKSRFI